MDSISQKFKSNDLIPLHAGSTVLVNKNDLIYISHKSLNDPVQYTSKLTHLIFGDEVLIECARKPPKLRFESLDQDCVQSIIYHIVKVFTHRGANVTEEIVMSYIQDRLDQIAKTMILKIKITVGSKILIPSNSIGNILQYTTTQRGRTMLIYDGYRYVENRQSQKNIFWRCSRYVRYGCRATVVTSKEGDSITIRIAGQPHTHDKELKCDTLLNDDKDLFTITNDRGTLYL